MCVDLGWRGASHAESFLPSFFSKKRKELEEMDPLKIGGKEFHSRFFLGTGKFSLD